MVTKFIKYYGCVATEINVVNWITATHLDNFPWITDTYKKDGVVGACSYLLHKAREDSYCGIEFPIMCNRGTVYINCPYKLNETSKVGPMTGTIRLWIITD